MAQIEARSDAVTPVVLTTDEKVKVILEQLPNIAKIEMEPDQTAGHRHLENM
jgi:hypothetical protein